MHSYRNLSGNSGVRAYRIEDGAIVVRFDNATYRYTDAVTGARHVAAMQELARAGRGLSTYIAQHPELNYAAR